MSFKYKRNGLGRLNQSSGAERNRPQKQHEKDNQQRKEIIKAVFHI
jgi:hypothetical protein